MGHDDDQHNESAELTHQGHEGAHSHDQHEEGHHGHTHEHPHEHDHQHDHKHEHDGHCHDDAHTHSHAHSHGHGHHHHHHHHAEGNILVAFLLNLFFAAVELVGGLYTGSVAILSDSLHDLGDSCSLGVAWYLERLSKKGRDRYFSYGYKRFSLLGSLLISVILLVGSFFVITESIERIIHPARPHAEGMFLLAIFGLLINGYAAWRMSGGHSLNERSMRLHLMEDVLGWIAVLIVSVVMYFVDLPILDPLLSLGITAWILYNVYFNLRDNFRILLQGVPVEVDQEGFVHEVEALRGVLSVHDVHIWTLNGEQHIASLHLVFDCPSYPTPKAWAELKQEVRRVASRYQLEHITIELDPRGCSCGMEHC